MDFDQQQPRPVINTHCSVCHCLSSSHIMEHLEGVIDKPETDMTPQELQLHYFKMHDYDGNNLLDGLELATAISHVHREVTQSTGHLFHQVFSQMFFNTLEFCRREERTVSP